MSEKYTIVSTTICSLAVLFTASVSIKASAAECLSAPNAQSRPGTHWYYRTDRTTNQRCWYLKDVSGSSPSRPASESAAPSNGGPGVAASPASTESESPIKAWFFSTFATLSGRASSSTETAEPSTSAPSVTRRPPESERTELKKPQQSKSEPQIKSEQSKSQREQSEPTRAQGRSSQLALAILEAAGDKLVPNSPPELTTSALEAAGDKDVVPPRADLEHDWQKALYEEFLVWRTIQLLLQ